MNKFISLFVPLPLLQIGSRINCLESDLRVDAIYIELHKDSDIVDHPTFLPKLFTFSFYGIFLPQLSSYLTKRIQTVKKQLLYYNKYCYNNHLPKEITVLWRPTGLSLGSFIFIYLYFTLMMYQKSSCTFLLFDDDLKIYRSVTVVSDALLLQEELNSLSSWCSRNEISFNLTKCHVTCSSRKLEVFNYPCYYLQYILSPVDTVRDSEMYFPSLLSFLAHCQYIGRCGFKTLGFIYRSFKLFSNTITLQTPYRSLLHSWVWIRHLWLLL